MKSVFSKLAILLFHLLFLVVPLIFTSVNDELFEFNKMLAVYAFTLLLLACWAGESIVRQKLVFKRTPLDIPILIFLLSQLVSTAFSINLHTSLFGYYTRFNGGLLSVFSYIALYYLFVAFVEAKHIRSLVTSILVGGVLSAIYAFPEHFGYSPSCFMFTGKFDVSCWVQDVKTRVFGTFGQPNWLAAYLGMLLPLAIVGIKRVETEVKLLKDEGAGNWLSTLIRLCLAALFIAVLFFTGSRSGIIAVGTGLSILGFGVIFFLFKTLKEKTNRDAPRVLMAYGLSLLATVALVAVMTLIIPNPIQDKLFSLIKRAAPAATSESSSPASQPSGTQLEVGGSESGQIRNVVWKGALRVWQRYPFFGSGVETFAYSYYKDRPVEHNVLSEWDFLYNKAHNEFLNYLATTGMFGLAAYLIMLGGFIIFPVKTALSLFHLKEKKWKHQIETVFGDIFLLLSLSAGIIIVSISNFFGFSTVMVSMLMFIFPALSVVVAAKYKVAKKETEDETVSEMTSSQWLIVFCALGVLLLPLLYVRKLWIADVAFARGKQLDASRRFETGFDQLRKATDLVPEEPTFHDEYSYNLASLAVSFAQAENATQAAEFASMAIAESNRVIELNPVHTNFWKTRVKVFLTLAQLDQKFNAKAEEALETARELSPTDPKIVLYLALMAQSQNNLDNYHALLLKTIELKPNFEEARSQLAKYYESQQQNAKAIEQYEYMIKFINPENQAARDRIASLSARKK